MKDKIERISEACELHGLSLIFEHPYEKWSVYRCGDYKLLAHFCLDKIDCDQIDYLVTEWAMQAFDDTLR